MDTVFQEKPPLSIDQQLSESGITLSLESFHCFDSLGLEPIYLCDTGDTPQGLITPGKPLSIGEVPLAELTDLKEVMVLIASNDPTHHWQQTLIFYVTDAGEPRFAKTTFFTGGNEQKQMWKINPAFESTDRQFFVKRSGSLRDFSIEDKDRLKIIGDKYQSGEINLSEYVQQAYNIRPQESH